jgi:hypothetical protein
VEMQLSFTKKLSSALIVAASLLLLVPLAGEARTSSKSTHPHGSTAPHYQSKSSTGPSTHSTASHPPHTTYAPSASHSSRAPSTAPGVARDSSGKIKRSSTARESFERSHPCPSTGKSSGACPGYIVDHVVPLKRGGADSPSNMQWQTKEAAKAKDRVE